MGHDGHIQEQKRMPSDVHLDFQTYFRQRLLYLERLRHLSAALAQFIPKDTERNLWFYMEPYTLRLLRFGRAHSPLPRMYGGSYRPRVEMEREGVRESEREIRENPIARTKERKILENCLTKQ